MQSTEQSYVFDARFDSANMWLVMLAEKAQIVLGWPVGLY